MRKLLVMVAALVVVTAACSSSNNKASTTTTTASGAIRNISVQLDGKAADYNGVFTAFFPDDVSAHPGDTVKFEVPRVNEPHTVAFGTLVDKAVAKVEQLGPTASVQEQEATPELQNVPDVFPHVPGHGRPDANQSAAQPCFLASGVPPLSQTGGAPACPKVAQPDFDGTQSFYNSGALINDGESFSMKLSPSIKPGTYSFMCAIHRGAMTAKLTVAPPTQSIPSAAEQTAKGKVQFNQLEAKLKPVANGAEKANGTSVNVGLGDPSVFNALIAQFGPKDLSVPVGGSVTWNMFLFHSISFGYTAADVGALTKAADGSVHLTAALAPAGVSTPPTALDLTRTTPLSIDAGSYDGTGKKSTGIMGSLPPNALIATKMTFTKAGTYTYQCLFHRDMQGTIKVG